MPINQVDPSGWPARLLRLGNHDRSTHGQHAEDIVDRQIKTERRQRQDPAAPPDAKTQVHIEDRVRGTAMTDHDPFGLPS